MRAHATSQLAANVLCVAALYACGRPTNEPGGGPLGSGAVSETTQAMVNAPNSVNRALGKTVYTSTNGSNPASYAVDGSFSNYWFDGTPSVFPDWLYVDLGAQYNVDEVDVFSWPDNGSPDGPANTFGLRSFNVQFWYGAPINNWLDFPGSPINYVNGAIKNHTKLNFYPTPARYIRILVNGVASGYTYSLISELQVYDATYVNPTEGGPVTWAQNYYCSNLPTSYCSSSTVAPLTTAASVKPYMDAAAASWNCGASAITPLCAVSSGGNGSITDCPSSGGLTAPDGWTYLTRNGAVSAPSSYTYQYNYYINYPRCTIVWNYETQAAYALPSAGGYTCSNGGNDNTCTTNTAIGSEWGALHWDWGTLGPPISNPGLINWAGVSYQLFRNGMITWSSAYGAHYIGAAGNDAESISRRAIAAPFISAFGLNSSSTGGFPGTYALTSDVGCANTSSYLSNCGGNTGIQCDTSCGAGEVGSFVTYWDAWWGGTAFSLAKLGSSAGYVVYPAQAKWLAMNTANYGGATAPACSVGPGGFYTHWVSHCVWNSALGFPLSNMGSGTTQHQQFEHGVVEWRPSEACGSSGALCGMYAQGQCTDGTYNCPTCNKQYGSLWTDYFNTDTTNFVCNVTNNVGQTVSITSYAPACSTCTPASACTASCQTSTNVNSTCGLSGSSCNPTILADVAGAFAAVPTANSYTAFNSTTGGGMSGVDSDGHIEGVQRVGGNTIVLSSTNGAKLYIVRYGSITNPFPFYRWGTFAPNTTLDALVTSCPLQQTYSVGKHAGGIQSFDSYVYVPVSESDPPSNSGNSYVFAIDTKPGNECVLVDDMLFNNFSPSDDSSGNPEIGGVGVTRRLDGSFLFVFAADQSEGISSKNLQFWATDPSNPNITSANALSSATLIGTWYSSNAASFGLYKMDGTHGDPSDILVGYQSVNLVTQADEAVFMIGTYQDNKGQDKADLFRVDICGGPGVPSYCDCTQTAICLTEVQMQKHMIINDNTYGRFDGAGGIYLHWMANPPIIMHSATKDSCDFWCDNTLPSGQWGLSEF